MQQIFNEGHPIFKDDMHSMTATNMFRIIKNNPEWICDKKEHKKERTIAKNMLFKLLFGGSDFTVAQDLGVEIEEGRKFYNAFFDGNPGMRENFEITKQKAMQNGWVELDAYTEKRWFFKDFEKMNSLYQQAWKCYPEGYSKMSKEERQKVKESLKTSHPHLSSLWKEYMVLKGKLERAALNYRRMYAALCSDT
jgi:DNA polymerase I-like protein with 3'-5' exonuclease and polymerase domains